MKTRETHQQRKRKRKRAVDRLAEMEKELAEVAKRNARFKREITKLVNENQTLHARVDQLEQ